MAYKCSQFNFIFKEIIKLIDNDTLLLIISDHG